MLSLQEISDRLEIQILMNTYSNAIDARDFDRLDQVFTPDAYIDYRAMGGIDGRFPDVKAWLRVVLVKFPNYFHMVTNTELTLAGESARGRTICFNPMETPLPEGGSQVMFLGLWYLDRLVRTPSGWRIAERVEQACFQHHVPPHMKIPAA
jgi:hypothetical protein